MIFEESSREDKNRLNEYIVSSSLEQPGNSSQSITQAFQLLTLVSFLLWNTSSPDNSLHLYRPKSISESLSFVTFR